VGRVACGQLRVLEAGSLPGEHKTIPASISSAVRRPPRPPLPLPPTSGQWTNRSDGAGTVPQRHPAGTFAGARRGVGAHSRDPRMRLVLWVGSMQLAHHFSIGCRRPNFEASRIRLNQVPNPRCAMSATTCCRGGATACALWEGSFHALAKLLCKANLDSRSKYPRPTREPLARDINNVSR